MVCKEDVCTWFRDLSAAKRIDLMCGLLQMCLPLEKRFLGSYLEDLCSSDYTALKAEETRANDPTENRKLIKDFTVPEVRSKANVILALMYSTNNVCSSIMFEFLTSIQHIVQELKDDTDHMLLEDFLLAMTMAVFHPAFSFNQRCKLSEQLKYVENNVRLKSTLSQDDCEVQSVDGNSSSSSSSSSSLSPGPDSSSSSKTMHSCLNHNQTKLVHVENIELIKGSVKRSAEKNTLYQVHVTWSDGTKNDTYKTYQDFSNFHTELIKLFPKDSGAHKQERHIPFLPQEKGHSPEEMYEVMQKYVCHLTRLPDHILQCHHVTLFFQPLNRPPSKTHKQNNVHPSKEWASVSNSTNHSPAHKVRSQVIYNSQLNSHRKQDYVTTGSVNHGNNSPRSPLLPLCPLRPPLSGGSSPLVSPLSSPASSQYGGSRPGSPVPQTVPQWLKRIRLHKYAGILTRYSVQDLLQLRDEDLEEHGLTKGAQRRFRMEMDNIKKKMKQNGNSAFLLESDPNSRNSPVTIVNHQQQHHMIPINHHHMIYNTQPMVSITNTTPGGSIIPTRALFLHRHSNASSRDASPSSFSDDLSVSPSDSPQPDVTDNSTSIDVKMSKININCNDNNIYRANSMGGEGEHPLLAPHPLLPGLHSVSIQTGPMRPLPSYPLPPPHFMPRQMYRSPRTPLIRADGTPGYMLPRIPVSMHMPPPPLPQQPVMTTAQGLNNQHGNAAAANINSSVAVNGIAMNSVVVATPTTSVTYTTPSNGGGAQNATTQVSVSYAAAVVTTPTVVGTGIPAPANHSTGGVFMPPPPPLMLLGSPAGAIATNPAPPGIISSTAAPRPNTLDVGQSPSASPATSTTSVGPPDTATDTPPTQLPDNNNESSNTNSNQIAVQVPGILNMAPPPVNTVLSENTPPPPSVFQHPPNQNGSPVTIATGTRPVVTVAPMGSIQPPDSPTVILPPSTPVTPANVNSSHINPPPLGSVCGTPPAPQQPVILQHIPPTPPVMPSSLCDSPCSDCSTSGVGSSSNKSTSTTPQLQQLTNGLPPPFQQPPYQQMWPQQQAGPPLLPPHPGFVTFHPPHAPGTNGYASTTPGTPHQQPSYIYSPAPPYPPNGLTPEQINYYLLTQALVMQQQQQQFWSHMAAAGQMPPQQGPHFTYLQPGQPGGNHGKAQKTFTCYNCGFAGHKALDCPEPTMENTTSQSSYHLQMKPRDNGVSE